ncbi:acyl-CoA dehydrogenase C-terminal domain-containing protein [Acidocella sp. KAb 2-4]|uniref:acyl-CoA dehydrogenase C-terminal domain-containing protein n=1 Tax=Acidocella sp. KAb 2-4 TaxID=2885158 RepID=UPI001D07F79E|nr:acyl-CoA dehydrogenase C-terminal domain-containing protein [Acidocella sp. KAb 2-4]MCB5945062.1 acyl-CoA dehydrogenase C-terminal domain-containing protein [Acidocella sp. KAb 2-4]
MQTYTAPLRDMRFVLHELHGATADNAEFPPELLDSILEEAAKFCTEVLLPLNASGDEEGCHFENGVVRTPAGFKDAYKAFSEAGWGALNADPQYGGQGLPESVAKLVEEMICACNLSFGLYPGLSHGAYLALKSHGAEALKDFYLPKLVSGEWAGTMCLTEPHCGTDLGMLRTKAVPQEDGSYKLTGSKIFISAGEHDFTDNIVHLVLARLPDAPPGIKGISLFLVPKFLPDAEGKPGARNGVSCAAIEHKMGIKASATCQMNFDDATGWLVGTPHKGMQAMFVMMNSERLSVGTQGLGLGEAAYQGAVAYARERVQGRSLAGAKAQDKPADPIIVHPDVRRMLLTMRAYNEGCRAMGVWVAQALDAAERGDEAAADFVALMTPIVKALFTDLGFESTNLGVQCYGGHGYIRDHGMEQFVRDARIAMIYEGTNGIQALDLIGRKLPANFGRSLRRFFHPVAEFIEAHQADARIGKLVQGFARAFGALQLATSFVAEKGMTDPEEAGAAATDYLRLFGLVAMGFMWVRMALIAAEKAPQGGPDAEFYTAKLNTARFYVERILPQAGALLFTIKAGKAPLMDMAEAAF